MARKKKGGALASLTSKPKRRGKRGGGLGGFAFKSTGFERGKRGQARGLVGAMRLDGKSKRRDRNSMSGKLARIIADRMTRTERLQVNDAIRDAGENDEVLSAAQRDAQRVDPSRGNVVQRLVAYVRNRLSAFRRDDT